MEDLFMKDWESVKHILICAPIAFMTLFVFIRISGKRTLSKLTAFDFVVTVVLGSTLSSMMLAKVPLLEGSIALLIVIVLQYALAWTAKHSKALENVINGTPTLLYYNDDFVHTAMNKEVITREEILAEIRKYRIEDLEQVRAVVMELNGDITVIKKGHGSGLSSLDDPKLHN